MDGRPMDRWTKDGQRTDNGQKMKMESMDNGRAADGRTTDGHFQIQIGIVKSHGRTTDGQWTVGGRAADGQRTGVK